MEIELYKKVEEDIKKIEIKRAKYRKNIIIFLLIFVIGIMLYALNRQYGIISKLVNMNIYIQAENNNKYIGIGEVLDLEAKNSFGNIEENDIEWVSSDKNIIDISDGKIKGISIGRAKVYAVFDDKKSNEIEIECLVKVQNIELDKNDIVLPINTSETIYTRIYPENTTYNNLIWKSSNENIVTVKEGKIFGKGIGNCEILMSDVTGSVIKKCSVKVVDIPSDTIVLDDIYVEISKGENYILSERIYPMETTNKDVEWISTDESVITVNNGSVYAKNCGQADIVVKTIDGKTASCTFNIIENSKYYDIRYAKVDNMFLKQKPDEKSDNIVNLSRNNELQLLVVYDNWSKVRVPTGEVGYIKNNAYTFEKSYFISNVPFLDQNVLGYPTGCEAVSATMVAQFYGYDVLSEDVINNTPTDERGIWKDYVVKEDKQEEVIYGGNPFEVFVGHPSKDYNEGSYGCYAQPIIESLKILNIKCKNISGCSYDELLNYIKEGIPVVVWGTYNGRDIIFKEEWTFPDNSGSYVNLKGEHCMVLIGYDDDKVYLNDPIAGKNSIQSKEQFFKNWDILYRQAIVIY